MDSSDDETAAKTQPAPEPRKLKRLQRRRLSEEHLLAVNKLAEASTDLLNTSSVPTVSSLERHTSEAIPETVPEQQSSPAQKPDDPAAGGTQPPQSTVLSGTPVHKLGPPQLGGSKVSSKLLIFDLKQGFLSFCAEDEQSQVDASSDEELEQADDLRREREIQTKQADTPEGMRPDLMLLAVDGGRSCREIAEPLADELTKAFLLKIFEWTSRTKSHFHHTALSYE